MVSLSTPSSRADIPDGHSVLRHDSRVFKDDGQKRAMSMIIECARDDASQVAVHIGTEELVRPTGFHKLVDTMYKIVYPHTRNEAGELHRIGCT